MSVETQFVVVVDGEGSTYDSLDEASDAVELAKPAFQDTLQMLRVRTTLVESFERGVVQTKKRRAPRTPKPVEKPKRTRKPREARQG